MADGHYPGLPLEQRISALRDGDVTNLGEPVGSTPLTVQPPKEPTVADDIITRLRIVDHTYTEPWSQTLMNEAADEIERLRAEVDLKGYRVDDLHALVARQRFALALACGLLSTYEDHSMFAPDQLMDQFMKEADRG